MNYYPKRHEYTIEIAGNKLKDLDYLQNYVFKLVQKLFNFSPKIYCAKNQNTIYLKIRDKKIFHFLKEKGFITGKKNNISIPNWILDNKENLLSFTKGLFDTDGHLCFKNKEGKKYPVVGITSKSKDLLLLIKVFLESNNIYSYLGSHRSDRGSYSLIYRIQISGGNNISLFFNKIGSNNPRNTSNYNLMASGGIEPP